MKKYLLSLCTLCLIAVSCSYDKPYTINGVISMPDSLQMGDTLVATPSFEGWMVYMLDLDGSPIDSTEIADNQFSFSGKVDKRNPFFVYLSNDICVGMIAVEPGDINVCIDETSLTATDSPTNDMMTDLDISIQSLQEEVYDVLTEMQSGNPDEQLSDSLLMPIYMEFMNRTTQLLDSFYTANQGTLGAQYVVNYITSQAQSSAELLEAIEDYPEDIKNSQLIKARLEYMQQIESYYQMIQSQQGEEEYDEVSEE